MSTDPPQGLAEGSNVTPASHTPINPVTSQPYYPPPNATNWPIWGQDGTQMTNVNASSGPGGPADRLGQGPLPNPTMLHPIGVGVSDPMKPSSKLLLVKCSIHPKPDLNCRECRKTKASRHAISDMQDMERGDLGASVDGTPVPIKATNHFNMNVVLSDSIINSEYYKSLASIHDIDAVCDEIRQYANSVEPTLSPSSRTPSTLFCCLYKMFQLQPTDIQIERLLMDDYGVVRCCGFLFLRYVLPPEMLWDWVEPYLMDDFTFKPAENTPDVTISTWLERILLEDKYYSTPLPRIPMKIKANYGNQMVPLASHRKRRDENRNKSDRFRPGVDVCVCYDSHWLDAEIVSNEPVEDVQGQVGVYVRLLDDTADEDEVYVDLAYIVLRDRWDAKEAMRKAKERIRLQRGWSRDEFVSDFEALQVLDIESDDHSNIAAEARRKEMEKAISKGKDYARRPTSYKAALSTRDRAGELGMARGVKRSRSPSKRDDGFDAKKTNQEEAAAAAAAREALLARYTSSTQKSTTFKQDNTLEERFKMGQ